MQSRIIKIEIYGANFSNSKFRKVSTYSMIIPYGYWITKVKWSLWNVLDIELRTNNMIEGEFLFLFLQLGWNHRFNRLVAWHFFDCLKKEEVCVRQQMLKIMMDGSKQINKKAAAIQERIYSLEWQFKEKQINIGGLFEGLSLLIETQNWYFFKIILRIFFFLRRSIITNFSDKISSAFTYDLIFISISCNAYHII